MTRSRDEEDEDRRWLWLAIPGSLVLHAWVVSVLPAAYGRELRGRPAAEVSAWIDAPSGAVGASGEAPVEVAAAGAPAGSEAVRDVASPPTARVSELSRSAALGAEGNPSWRAVGSEPVGSESVGSESVGSESGASESGASERAEAAVGDGAGGLSSDAFLDALLARGEGAGGGGGEGCADPVVGTWRARRYDAEGVGTDALGHHASFTIRVSAREGERLEGVITLRAWSGSAEETSPPRCRPGHYDHTVRMRARGTLRGDVLTMDALDHERTEHCIDLGRWSYNLDHFRGHVRGETFDAVNNDGGREVNAPYRFRRVSCR